MEFEGTAYASITADNKLSARITTTHNGSRQRQENQSNALLCRSVSLASGLRIELFAIGSFKIEMACGIFEIIETLGTSDDLSRHNTFNRLLTLSSRWRSKDTFEPLDLLG